MVWILTLVIMTVFGAGAGIIFDDIEYYEESYASSGNSTLFYSHPKSSKPVPIGETNQYLMQISTMTFWVHCPEKHEQIALLDGHGSMEISEGEGEADEEEDVGNNNVSPATPYTRINDSDATDDQFKRLLNGMNGYGDVSLTFDLAGMQDMDEVKVENARREPNYDANGSDYGGGYEFAIYDRNDSIDDAQFSVAQSVKDHKGFAVDMDDDGDEGERDCANDGDEDGQDYRDGLGEKVDLYRETAKGSMSMHPDVENNEDWVRDDTQNGVCDDEEEEDGSGGGGNVQMNDVENNENWVDQEFDAESIGIKASDNEENQEIDKNIENIFESVDIVNEGSAMINKENDTEYDHDEEEGNGDGNVDEDNQKEEEKMESPRIDDNDYAFNVHALPTNKSVSLDIKRSISNLDAVIGADGDDDDEEKYSQTVEHQVHGDCASNDSVAKENEEYEGDVELENGVFYYGRQEDDVADCGDYVQYDLSFKRDSHDRGIDVAESSVEQFANDDTEMVENMDEDDDEEEDDNDDAKNAPDDDDVKEEKKMDPYRFDDDHDDEFNVPTLPQKKMSVVLDIEKYCNNFAVVIEADGRGDDEEKYFQFVQYQAETDCDSDDFVVVKRKAVFYCNRQENDNEYCGDSMPCHLNGNKADDDANPLQCVGAVNAYSTSLSKGTGEKSICPLGSGVATASYAFHNLGITNLNDLCTDINRSSSLVSYIPLLVDFDAGFGNALSIQCTILHRIKNGATACHIGDQEEGNETGGHGRNISIVDTFDDGLRIATKTANESNIDNQFIIMATTDAYADERIDALLKGYGGYINGCGADMLFSEVLINLEIYYKLNKNLVILLDSIFNLIQLVINPWSIFLRVPTVKATTTITPTIQDTTPTASPTDKPTCATCDPNKSDVNMTPIYTAIVVVGGIIIIVVVILIVRHCKKGAETKVGVPDDEEQQRPHPTEQEQENDNKEEEPPTENTPLTPAEEKPQQELAKAYDENRMKLNESQEVGDDELKELEPDIDDIYADAAALVIIEIYSNNGYEDNRTGKLRVADVIKIPHTTYTIDFFPTKLIEDLLFMFDNTVEREKNKMFKKIINAVDKRKTGNNMPKDRKVRETLGGQFLNQFLLEKYSATSKTSPEQRK